MSMCTVLDKQGKPRQIDSVLADELVALRTTHKQKRIDELEERLSASQIRTEQLEGELEQYKKLGRDLLYVLKLFPGWTDEGLVGHAADIYPYRKEEFARLCKEVLREVSQ